MQPQKKSDLKQEKKIAKQHRFVIIYLNTQNILSIFKMNIDKLPITLRTVVHSENKITQI